MRTKLKELTKFSPKEPLFAGFLQEKGFSPQLLYEYVKNGWLEKVSDGVYKLSNGNLDILQIVKSLQVQLNMSVHIASRSALLIQGISHFGRNTDKLQVAVTGKQRLTKWLKSINEIDFIRMNIFNKPENNFNSNNGIIISNREMAFIEMAELVPKKISYEEFYKTLELTPNLRAAELQQLLENCTSSKAKKIFLATAESLNYHWYNQIDLNKIKIGSGILQLSKNGVYNGRFKIYLEKINE